jgi:hypothetical protein
MEVSRKMVADGDGILSLQVKNGETELYFEALKTSKSGGVASLT